MYEEHPVSRSSQPDGTRKPQTQGMNKGSKPPTLFPAPCYSQTYHLQTHRFPPDTMDTANDDSHVHQSTKNALWGLT